MLTDAMKGLKVLDLGQYIPGPYAALLLADLGAEVVKVEPPGGDPMRTFGPPDPDGLSPFYRVLNRNKTVIRLDLKTEEGRAHLEALLRKAHVLVESYRPGVLERLGFGRARLEQIASHLVHCALSGFGQEGPLRLRAGHDLGYLALSGALDATGPAERPVMPFPPLADHAGALTAVIGVLAALLRRLRTGRGAVLDVSLFESAAALNGLGLVLGQRGGLAREADALNGGAAYYRCYRTADGRFAALAAIEPVFWRAFCGAVARPDWADRQAEPLPQRGLIADLEALFATRPLAEWQAVLGGVDCCFEPVLHADEVPDQPHVRARDLIHRDGAGDGLIDTVLPVLLDGTPPPPRRPLVEADAAAVVAAWQGRG
ncbi:CaiB/BaiF CoA transferase family protein [Roseospira goensis]|uniref:Crotonobetainyl-CoA:carnitine CoA-transferase CaiB-like acyl-CoA transferase n=1 Tax=Roseospira goensis TaxID=391922 RepID=A0A7W6RYM8_9PROT|nr:CoA transferase [Roseospira goensis]MBB4284967.1 crotonobetainyl-CoA:carnitine CoA-transferase CaiB-like acyl-CoA transferase [Roseospira goensis]